VTLKFNIFTELNIFIDLKIKLAQFNTRHFSKFLT
jgi:hypothetical protein